jgi:RimJ/RimL family protein N-acetyltransferase
VNARVNDVTTLTFRHATLDDAELAADLMTAAYPALAHDPAIIRYRWEHPRERWSSGRFIAEIDRRPIAYLGWFHAPWDSQTERYSEVEVALHQARLASDLLTLLWQKIGAEAEADGAYILEAYAVEDEIEVRNVLERIGYKRDRIDRVWDLDLHGNGERLLAAAKAAREEAAGSGIKMTTLAGWRDSNALRKLHDLDVLTRRDIPSTVPYVPEAYKNFVERINGPDRRNDRFWIALNGDQPVAMSYLRIPPVRGSVWTGFTCCHPEHRGRGLARAVKLQSLAQAIELGIQVVRTANDSENAPMLHINEKLGYQPAPGFVSYEKRVQTF